MAVRYVPRYISVGFFIVGILIQLLQGGPALSNYPCVQYVEQGITDPIPRLKGVSTWRKLHLAVNQNTHEIEAETLTENSCDDASQVDPLLDQVAGKIDGFYGDGDYDKWKVYAAIGNGRNASAIIAAAFRKRPCIV